MPPSNSYFRPLFLFLLFVAVSTVFTVVFYYHSDGITTPLPSESPQRESLAARSLLGAVDVFKPYSGEQPLLTMFTTFKNAKDRFQIHSNVLHNWALYIPIIQPILFTHETDENLVAIARNLGWLVIKSPRVSSSGVPYFKEMYFEAQKNVESVFYGYFNGDLLFDDGLVNTLMVIEQFIDQLHKTLIVGQRTNFPVKGQEIYKKADVTSMSRKKGKLFRVDAEDFFVIAHNSFIWDKIADIVIGRPAYDNYIVGLAIMNKVAVVDATKTLLALHQSGKDGDFAGHKNKDRNFNFKAIGPFNWGRGVTSASQYFTKYRNGHIELWKRSPAQVLLARVRTTPTPSTTTMLFPVLAQNSNQTYNMSSSNQAAFTNQSSTNHTLTSHNSTETLHHVQFTQRKDITSYNASTSTALENRSILSNSISTQNSDSSTKMRDTPYSGTISGVSSVIHKDDSRT